MAEGSAGGSVNSWFWVLGMLLIAATGYASGAHCSGVDLRWPLLLPLLLHLVLQLRWHLSF